MPLADMFRHILRVDHRDDEDVYDPSRFSEHAFLTLFAFCTRFVYILKVGLETFNRPRYRNFAKRLGQLIRHTVEYVSDHWQAFKSRPSQLHPAMGKRIQVEYDNFFLRAIKCIFGAQKLGAWQYLTLIPYGTLSVPMLWRIFYTLHQAGVLQDEVEKNFGDDVRGKSKGIPRS